MTLIHEATITTLSGDIVTLSNITPDPSWYREDPNVPTYTITAIIPDDSTTGPHITGFAPSEHNPFNAEETKKFRVWANEELTNMKWYVNGNLRSSGSMEYNWVVEEGSHTIMFAGSNSDGSVTQSWEVTEGVQIPVEEPVEDPTLSPNDTTFTPSASSLTAEVGKSTTFNITTDQLFTSLNWYLDGEPVASGTMSYTQEWVAPGTHSISFEGDAGQDLISNTWTVVVSEVGSSIISISPSSSVVAPGDTFSLDVYIDPGTPLSGSQFDLQYSSLASVISVQEGGLFSSGGLSTTFYEGEVDELASLLSAVYSAIVDSGTISNPGSMATVDMVAGSSTGMLELALPDVLLSDADSAPAPYTVSNATVLVDSAPVFDPISAEPVTEGDTIMFMVNATDPDSDPLTYSCTSLPDGATFSQTTKLFTWNTQEGDAGEYSAVFDVTDGYLNDSVTVGMTVAPVSVTDMHPRWDVNEDGVVNDLDMTLVRHNYGNTYTDNLPGWDVNQDGIVNIQDLSMVASRFGEIIE
ncbi:putative Ig domain-containing protein [Methanolobus halotolerans]|uniref:putative Ig domain-containing protein n=1 Tax=Methanolobus halotolerans TaxID=2052935 RepID=UPI00107F0EF7|nr:putative Ig domain-containing protein [Methanolobus halotolerans]